MEAHEIDDEKIKESLAYKWEYLVKFVQNHVEIMLRKLYIKIIEVEEENSAPDSNRHAGSQIHERNWLKMLYSENNGRIRIVGPLGERPLHVCALGIDRFRHIDFQGQGNYVATGIVEGILAFARNIKVFVQTAYGDKRPDLVTYFRREIVAEFGKDYCAIVGDYLVKTEDANQKSGGSATLPLDWVKDHDKRPPYWEHITKWQQMHLKTRGLLKPPARFSRILVTKGIFEGETILFPLIAGNHLEAIYKLLEWQKDCMRSDGPRASTGTESLGPR